MSGAGRHLALTGFPGWLTEALLEDIHNKPEGIERITALTLPSLAAGARAAAKRFPLVTSVEPFDLGDPQPPARPLEGVDTLLHSAAVIHVKRTSDWYRINTTGTERLAEAAKRAGVRRFVFISSNAAGGRSNDPSHLLSESDTPRPLSHYGRSKLLAEQALMRLHEAGKFEVAILRPSMFYGPPVPPRHIDIYRRILNGRMPMIGSGDYARSITHIDNLVQACRLAMSHPAAAGETYYVVDRPVYTTRLICEAMASALGTPLKLLRLPATVGPLSYAADRALASLGVYVQPLHLVGESHWHVGISCAKLETQLGYQPRMELEEGMRKAVEWCRANGKL